MYVFGKDVQHISEFYIILLKKKKKTSKLKVTSLFWWYLLMIACDQSDLRNKKIEIRRETEN